MDKLIQKYIFAAAFVVSTMLIGSRCLQYGVENHRLSTIGDALAQYTNPPPEAVLLSDIYINAEDFLNIAGMQSENSDVVGYIRADGTYIDYPVLKSEDQDKYLQRDFWGKKSLYGSIFMDNASYEGGFNLVLYGHNMKSGRMFGSLKHYLEPGFSDNYPYLKYIDAESIQIYRVSAILSASADEDTLNRVLIPYTEAEMSALSEFISAYGYKVYRLPEWGDKLLTLATCEYSHKNGRLYVIGILENRIEK